MRVCHKDTCPVGVATQNKDLRALYEVKHIMLLILCIYCTRIKRNFSIFRFETCRRLSWKN
ncbi:glutamate synthase-related protein [Staphylococcus aureus]|nr:glutamate synthase-related protein [Staphylococcus aureus]